MGEESGRYINEEQALARVRGNRAMFERMLGLFLNSKEFDAFEEAIAVGDNDRAADVAHGIKGMTGNLGLDLVYETSTELMNQLRQGGYDQELLDRYREVLEETRRRVSEMIGN